jgi:hypothetical protein
MKNACIMVENPDEMRPLRIHTNRWVYLNENDYASS